MSFQSPLWLLALLIVPALVVGYILRERRRASDAARFATPALLPNVVAHRPGIRRHLPVAVLLLAFSALIVGVARPHATVKVPREEATVILAVDVSNSMRANDVKPTRLGAAQSAAEAFAASVPKKFQVGVVTFASRATVALPPTTDRSLVHTALTALHSSGGTALGDAVALSTQLVQRQRTIDGRVPPAAVLLISDGKQDGGRTTATAAAAKAKAAADPGLHRRRRHAERPDPAEAHGRVHGDDPGAREPRRPAGARPDDGRPVLRRHERLGRQRRLQAPRLAARPSLDQP